VWCNKFKGLIWAAAALGALLVLAAGLAAAIEAGYFRGPLIRFVASQVGRTVQVDQDLEDLYFLTGVKLINTGRYRLAGKVTRRGTKTRFTDLAASSGQSDAHGSVSIDSSSDRPQLDIDLNSQLLRFADLGLRATGREPESSIAASRLMSDAALTLRTWRRDDAVASFRARRVEVGSLPVQDVAAALAVDHGVLTAKPLTGHVFEGASLGAPGGDIASGTRDMRVVGRNTDIIWTCFADRGVFSYAVHGLDAAVGLHIPQSTAIPAHSGDSGRGAGRGIVGDDRRHGVGRR